MIKDTTAENTIEKLISTLEQDSQAAIDWYKINEMIVNPDKFQAIFVKGTVMQIEKALINDCLHVWKASWKFHIPSIYDFAVIYRWNLLFS